MVSFTQKITHQIPGLKKGDVHVWRLALNGSIGQGQQAILSSNEIDKINRLRNQQHRAQALLMRVQLRQLLSRYLGLNSNEIKFSYREYGKPYLADASLSFNVSDSGSQALVAVSLTDELGVDIENWRTMANLAGMVRRNFSANEQQQWLDVLDKHQEATFFDLWTRKEAFIKATGRGLGMGVARCGFSLLKPNDLLECPVEYGNPSEWSCVSLDVGERVSASLVIRAQHCQPTLYTFEPENLPTII